MEIVRARFVNERARLMVRSARLWPPPLVVAGYVDNSPTLCLCSRGWVKAVFTEALGEEVEVELVQAIGRGDECCEFMVHPRPGRSH